MVGLEKLEASFDAVEALKVTKLAIFNMQDQVLLLKRSADDPMRAGEYDLPGGAIDPGETLQQALGREVMEECGFVIPVEPTLLTCFSVSEHFWFGYGAQMTTEAPDITLSHEHSEHVWVPLEDVPSYNLRYRHNATVQAAGEILLKHA